MKNIKTILFSLVIILGFSYSTTTLAATVTYVDTLPASNITTTSADLKGYFEKTGMSVATTKTWFEYADNANFNNSKTTAIQGFGGDSAAFTTNISGLSQNTAYYFRASAQNSNILTSHTIFTTQTITHFFLFIRI